MACHETTPDPVFFQRNKEDNVDTADIRAYRLKKCVRNATFRYVIINWHALLLQRFPHGAKPFFVTPPLAYKPSITAISLEKEQNLSHNQAIRVGHF
jgi:hypothetical protein